MSDAITVVALGVCHLPHITTTLAAQNYVILPVDGGTTFADHPISLNDIGFLACVTFSRFRQWFILLVVNFPLDLFYTSLAKMVEWRYEDRLILVGHTLLMLVLECKLVLICLGAALLEVSFLRRHA